MQYWCHKSFYNIYPPLNIYKGSAMFSRTESGRCNQNAFWVLGPVYQKKLNFGASSSIPRNIKYVDICGSLKNMVKMLESSICHLDKGSTNANRWVIDGQPPNETKPKQMTGEKMNLFAINALILIISSVSHQYLICDLYEFQGEKFLSIAFMIRQNHHHIAARNIIPIPARLWWSWQAYEFPVEAHRYVW